MAERLKVIHIITGLNAGGAQTVLYRLLQHMDQERFQSQVLSLIPMEPLGEKIRALGIEVRSLEMSRGWASLPALWRLVGLLRRVRPDVVQTWLYHADLLGLLAGKLANVPAILWNIRNSDMDFARYRRLSGLVVRACAWLSGLPDAVVVNSRAGEAVHTQLGYHPRAWILIPNGVDTQFFRPNPQARSQLRTTLGLNEETPLIGIVARYDPMKGYDIFMRAAGEISLQDPRVHFLLVGQDVDDANQEMAGHIVRYGLRGRVHLLGHRNDVERIHAALDLLVSASVFGEGFSNAVAEAMACGIPCVVTDVGDSGQIVGQTGAIVPPRDASALARACLHLLQLPARDRIRLGEQARQRVAAKFDIQTAVAAYETLYVRVAV
jgi:glycosyltransferase involved in cell wall biosynthesis